MYCMLRVLKVCIRKQGIGHSVLPLTNHSSVFGQILCSAFHFFWNKAPVRPLRCSTMKRTVCAGCRQWRHTFREVIMELILLPLQVWFIWSCKIIGQLDLCVFSNSSFFLSYCFCSVTSLFSDLRRWQTGVNRKVTGGIWDMLVHVTRVIQLFFFPLNI